MPIPANTTVAGRRRDDRPADARAAQGRQPSPDARSRLRAHGRLDARDRPASPRRRGGVRRSHEAATEVGVASARADDHDPAWVVDLSRLRRGDLALAGGKGANLGELIRAGFPVPPGFVITTAAYDHQAEAEPAILAAYDRWFAGDAVAVRSSATAEDLPEAAFAGQQESFLNIRGPAAVLDAVTRCWASLFSERAVAYRARQDIDEATVKLAVVVQRMLNADAAGVLFTANPVTGARNEINVDANPGLGEAVVAGLVTPDHAVLRRRWWGWQIVERRLGRREVIVRLRDTGGTEQTKPVGSVEPALSRRALRRLARMGARIERHFGRPQDVEWVSVAGRLWIVQARPMTALPPATAPSRVTRMFAGTAAEMLPARPYPLELTTWGPDLILTALLGPLLRVFGVELHPEWLFVEQDHVVVALRDRLPVRLTPGVLLAPLRLLCRARRYDPLTWRSDPLIAELEARVRALDARDLRALAWADLLTTVRQALRLPMLAGELRGRYLPGALLALAALRVVLVPLGRSDRFAALLTGVQTQTLAANQALAALAARIAADPVLARTVTAYEQGDLWAALETEPAGQALLADLRRFLDTYGHREAGGTMTLSQGTWRESPEVVLGVLKVLARGDPPPRQAGTAWQAALDDVLAHPLLRRDPLRAAFVRLVAGARSFAEQREDTRFYGTLVLPVLHGAAMEFGRRLTDVGVLDTPSDVFHLTFAELERIGPGWPPVRNLASELRATAARRTARRAALADVPLVDPRLLGATPATGDALVRGVPGSPGVAEGPVRVIHDTSEFGKLAHGDVLVAPYTNPAWTPLFQRAAAVVVDSGSSASHAAIVAREYGLPAVMATGDATRRLRDGERVRVDGSRGVVMAAQP